jgi:hypothetical protein
MRVQQIRAVWWVGGACSIAFVAIIGYASHRGWTPEKVERVVNSELPVGSDRTAIEYFLNTRDWSYTFDDAPNSFGHYAKQVNLPPASLGGAIYAEVVDANVGLFDTGRISVFFFLDPNGRLVKADVRVSRLSL